MTGPDPGQERLLVEAAQRDPSRFADLYEAHFQRVYAYVVRRVRDRHEAEDVTSEVFQQALANVGRFEWRGAPFAAWLFRIAAHAIADRMKRAARERGTPAPEPGEDPQLDRERVEELARLYRRVRELPADQRRVIEMRFTEGKSIRGWRRSSGAAKAPSNSSSSARCRAFAKAWIGAMAERDRADRFAGLVETILVRPDEAALPAEPELAELFRVALDLRDAPSEAYRARLGADLRRRAESMKQVATPHVPAGFRSITPYVIVRGADAFISFVKQVFGAEEVFRMAAPEGVIGHAEVRIGDSMLELSDGGDAWPPRPVALHVYVPDADATYARAMAAGARSLVAPMDMPNGDREGDVTDPFGNNWYIGTRREGGPVPQGMGTLTPTLHVKGTDRLIDFIKRAFGAQELDRSLAPDGAVLHAQLKLGDSVLELGEARGFVQPMPCSIHYYVEDVDRVYAGALAAGATALGAPSSRPYGDRAAEVADPFGNHWFIATHMEDVRYR